VDMVIAVSRTLTPEQRTHVATRLQSYIDDFHALAEPRTARTAAH